MGLTPGVSNQTEVDRVLGQPVKAVSETLLEYSGGDQAAKIYVQYRKGEPVLERLEALLSAPVAGDQIRARLNLPQQPLASQVNSKNKLEEYYGSSNCIVLTYSSSTSASGVLHIGYYSKTLYDKAVEKVPQQAPVQPASPGPALPAPAGAPASNYDQVTMQAWNAMIARDFAKALNILQEAIRTSPDRAAAYNLLGVAYLYGYNDIVATEKAMREVIARNDKASFRVHHDHGDGSFQSFCYGWLYIGKTEISFKSDEGHGFIMNKSDVKEAKANNFMGAGYSAFHIKLSSANYNFAPGTLKKPEANLILTLIHEDL